MTFPAPKALTTSPTPSALLTELIRTSVRTHCPVLVIVCTSRTCFLDDIRSAITHDAAEPCPLLSNALVDLLATSRLKLAFCDAVPVLRA